MLWVFLEFSRFSLSEALLQIWNESILQSVLNKYPQEQKHSKLHCLQKIQQFQCPGGAKTLYFLLILNKESNLPARRDLRFNFLDSGAEVCLVLSSSRVLIFFHVVSQYYSMHLVLPCYIGNMIIYNKFQT